MKRRYPKRPPAATMSAMDPQTARRADAEIARIIAESNKFGAETAKLQIEAAKMARERSWYPVVLVTAAVATTATFVKLFL